MARGLNEKGMELGGNRGGLVILLEIDRKDSSPRCTVALFQSMAQSVPAFFLIKGAVTRIGYI